MDSDDFISALAAGASRHRSITKGFSGINWAHRFINLPYVDPRKEAVYHQLLPIDRIGFASEYTSDLITNHGSVPSLAALGKSCLAMTIPRDFKYIPTLPMSELVVEIAQMVPVIDFDNGHVVKNPLFFCGTTFSNEKESGRALYPLSRFLGFHSPESTIFHMEPQGDFFGCYGEAEDYHIMLKASYIKVNDMLREAFSE